MEKLVEELGKVLEFKNTVDVGDIVLVVVEESMNAVYACVTSIDPDDSRKDEWWHVGLAFLSIPVQNTTWTLRTPQMTGEEIFTMGGKKRFVKAVKISGQKPVVAQTQPVEKSTEKKSFIKRVK